MNIFEAIAACFRKYGVFSGRAGRREFWFFTLFCAVVPAVFSLIFGSDSLISLIVTAGLLVPSFSVSWRPSRIRENMRADSICLRKTVAIGGKRVYNTGTNKNRGACEAG